MQFADAYDTSLLPPTSLTPVAYTLAGLLVGFGTKLGNGCTSGHGICDLARLSPRSLVAVLIFMTSAMITSFLTPPSSSIPDQTAFLRNTEDPAFHIKSSIGTLVTTVPVVMLLIAPFYSRHRDENARLKFGPAAVSGSLFATGLFISGMVYRLRVFGFLNVASIRVGQWDATLAMVMGGGLAVSFASYQLVEGFRVFTKTRTLSSPLMLRKGSKFSVPSNRTIDHNLMVGAAIFGMGWRLAGLCPGPALVMAGIGEMSTIMQWWSGFLMGTSLAEYVKRQQALVTAQK